MSVMIRLVASATLLAGVGPFAGTTALAQTRPSLADRFQIGSDEPVLCSAQLDRADNAATGLFDRAYSLVCRDARLPVGRLYALRLETDAHVRLQRERAARAECGEASPVAVEDLSGATVRQCRRLDLGIGYIAYEVRRGRDLFAAEGLRGYDAALRLALRTIALDRRVAGELPLTTAGGEDPAAFARAIARTQDAVTNRSAAYRSNAGGQYFESAEFFNVTQSRIAGTSLSPEEIRLNEALQQSNLGNYAAADALFESSAAASSDPVIGRLRRNYLALHLLNQGLDAAALAEAQRPLAEPPGPPPDVAAIDEATARLLDSENPQVRMIANADPPPLTRTERAVVLDAQGAYIAAAALRGEGRGQDAQALLVPALTTLENLRGGRVISLYWLRAQVGSELAAIGEAAGDFGGAETRLRTAARLMASEHPGTNAEWVSRIKLAGFLARRGNEAEALDLFRSTVSEVAASGETTSLRSGLGPYFALLERRATSDPAAVEDFFFASQTIVRLGVARSQFEFARILASGSDEISALYRTSTQISRDINRLRLEVARRTAVPGDSRSTDAIARLNEAIRGLEAEQTVAQAQLNAAPRYQVTASTPLSLREMQSALRPGEAYYKVFFVDGAAHALLVRPDMARIVPLAAGETQVGGAVQKLRDSIRKEVGGRTYVLPFDVAIAHELYQAIVQPAAAELGGVTHLIVEPDGALLSLPLTLLVTERAGVDAYLTRSRARDADPYDFSGIAWLGRNLATSTIVSPRTLYLFRKRPPTNATKAYLGLGENAPAVQVRAATATPDGLGVCTLPAIAWERPIPSTELVLARNELGGQGEILTGAQFTDTAIKNLPDLPDYRVVHFATHGIVTPPGRGCLPQPALMTSVGGAGSDGLLSFQEIFSLPINADIVLLSACDTAAGASQDVTRRALGELMGGGFALDGLVRSFLGAGARSVIASHWPVPEKPVNATTELIGRLFDAPAGAAVAQGLRAAQISMMDKPLTSHPYYWAAFSIIGDGAQPLKRAP